MPFLSDELTKEAKWNSLLMSQHNQNLIVRFLCNTEEKSGIVLSKNPFPIDLKLEFSDEKCLFEIWS
jgi:hypothetical protein